MQKAIDNEPMLLASMNNIPFLENACCNEGEASTYFYFTQSECYSIRSLASFSTHNIIAFHQDLLLSSRICIDSLFSL